MESTESIHKCVGHVISRSLLLQSPYCSGAVWHILGFCKKKTKKKKNLKDLRPRPGSGLHAAVKLKVPCWPRPSKRSTKPHFPWCRPPRQPTCATDRPTRYLLRQDQRAIWALWVILSTADMPSTRIHSWSWIIMHVLRSTFTTGSFKNRSRHKKKSTPGPVATNVWYPNEGRT